MNKAIKMMMGMGTPRKNKSNERMDVSWLMWLDLRLDVALAPAVGGRHAGDECADQQRDEEPQRRIC